MKKEDDESRKTFEALAIEDPARGVEPFGVEGVEPLEVEGDNGAKPKPLIDKMEEALELSDMQSAIAKLFPGDLGNRVINALMIARVAPDVFIPLLKMLVNEQIIKSNPNKAISVAFTVAELYTALSIGLDGKGRIDQIELAGASKETEELEQLGKGLFG